LVRRHRIPKPVPNDDNFFTVHDFNVNSQLAFYGRVFSLFGCDPFTREFLTKLGVRVPENGAAPVDSFTETRKVMRDLMLF
jgi:hypothetical protein